MLAVDWEMDQPYGLWWIQSVPVPLCTVMYRYVSESWRNTSLSGRHPGDVTTNGREENGDGDDEPPAGGRAKVKRRSA